MAAGEQGVKPRLTLILANRQAAHPNGQLVNMDVQAVKDRWMHMLLDDSGHYIGVELSFTVNAYRLKMQSQYINLRLNISDVKDK